MVRPHRCRALAARLSMTVLPRQHAGFAGIGRAPFPIDNRSLPNRQRTRVEVVQRLKEVSGALMLLACSHDSGGITSDIAIIAIHGLEPVNQTDSLRPLLRAHLFLSVDNRSLRLHFLTRSLIPLPAPALRRCAMRRERLTLDPFPSTHRTFPALFGYAGHGFNMGSDRKMRQITPCSLHTS